MITTLVECFDHDNAKVRALAVDAVIHQLDRGSGYYTKSNGAGGYRTPKAIRLGKVAKPLYARLPYLIGHLIKPRPARWVKIAGTPRSDLARHHPNELNTGIGASEIVWAMIDQSKAGKAKVRNAFLAHRPQIQKMLSNVDPHEVNPEVLLFVSDVVREEVK